ncbi:RecQ family ATP-dependent DNA helicase [Marinoscillum sp. MHG1-6]|uniref:RecQ family ATP-dependent DNA helicase n=1 Tax=Marinoscillum sp. MHG1-6 TaxID=2959627 RepID=UPI0021588402|nr:RecQ family ATP-dependent DNA helicase [Marinoscillum sp. MHG1-6]
MKKSIFLDLEVSQTNNQIQDIGSINDQGNKFHANNLSSFVPTLSSCNFWIGHNIIKHDLKYLGQKLPQLVADAKVIDTLPLSALLFPKKPYHKLVKDDKLQSEDLNNPLNDAIKARDLFFEEVSAFGTLDQPFQKILYQLLTHQFNFKYFFEWIGFNNTSEDLFQLIHLRFKSRICSNANINQLIVDHPIELAYCLVLINTDDQFSIFPKWILKTYPSVNNVMFLLRNNPCLHGCDYCNSNLNIHSGLKSFFNFDSYRTFGGEPLQENAVLAAVRNQSILTIFPTGGGKSITFQVPALMQGKACRGLTVVISPLQSLMKDQIDNLESHGITSAVTINGLLDPIERSKSLKRVESGVAHLLYISPESLRSKTIENIILGRTISRFVIDEAHCFSSWGHDFRVDYLYIGDFIKTIQEKKNLPEPIPVSCFTATAKRKVIEDIFEYFKSKLSLDLRLLQAKVGRTNLRYKVLRKSNDDEKYIEIRNLIDQIKCPTIIYVSRTRRASDLATRLSKDGYSSLAYHGKMDAKEKTSNQRAFIEGDANIMVATSAFGMGVDKKDVGLVIHYDISDSLENYVQEAGRAGRDESLQAECYVLYNEEDLSKHFTLLNQTKITLKEIQQVWSAIKKFKTKMSGSALEIARKAGWDDSVMGMENRITTAIAALEEAGYLKRGQNSPIIYASSIQARNAQEAIDKINGSSKFTEGQREQAIRIIKKLIATKSRKHSNEEEAEARVDYISDHLGIVKENVIRIINLLREEGILANSKDLTAYIGTAENINRSLSRLQEYAKIENYLLTELNETEKIINIKGLNESAENLGLNNVSPSKIRTILNFWTIKNWIKKERHIRSPNHLRIISCFSINELQEKQRIRHELGEFILKYLYKKLDQEIEIIVENEEALVEFSIIELKEAYETQSTLFNRNLEQEDIENSLFYLSKIEAIRIEGGFLVVHNRLTIERLELDNRVRFKVEDYQQLSDFYANKVEQIHIVGEYAKKMVENYQEALEFVDDYFQLNFYSFLNKYFKGSKRDDLRLNITPRKFQQLFGELSPAQLKIIRDSDSKYIAIAAGPGSGKTKVLVHKLAALLLMEDVKHEQLLMLTFSRAAATEFKIRLLKLVGNAALFVDIKTFHSYCFDILGKVGTLEKAPNILMDAVEKIQAGEVERKEITRTALVIDEAQDMSSDEYALIESLISQNEQMRVIAVGDDDQNVYEFRGSSSKYMLDFIQRKNATKYELVENYRSKSNLIDFTNQFANCINERLKQTPIQAIQKDNGIVKLIYYKSANLVVPLIRDVLETELSGTTAILTKTNEEAFLIANKLNSQGLKAKLVESHDSFSLSRIEEFHFFLQQIDKSGRKPTISVDDWESAKKNSKEKFKDSSNYEPLERFIVSFELLYPKLRFRSDLDQYIQESKIEDFKSTDTQSILVCTMHKSKGREFDNVFLLLQNIYLRSEESKRLLYVALTRAKHRLHLHSNQKLLDQIDTRNLHVLEDFNDYGIPQEFDVSLSMHDVYLSYFKYVQRRVFSLQSGIILTANEEGCTQNENEFVLKFSKSFKQKIEEQKTKGYRLIKATINYTLFWIEEETEQELKVVLPKVTFRRFSEI